MRRIENTAIAMIAVISLFIMIQACISKPETTPAPVPNETAPSLSAKPAQEDDWERTLSAAKKEGEFTLYSNYGSAWRQAFSEAMAKKYSITMQTLTGRSEETAPRLFREQQSRIHNADVFTISIAYIGPFQQEGFFQPLQKILILPEVTDPKVWWRGELSWLDPDEKTVFAFRESVTIPWVINTDLVKPGELKSWNDLLNPKWKGRILLSDPTAGGSAQKTMTVLAYGGYGPSMKGWDFIKALLKQEPDIQRDNRLMVEWVSRGKYPILIGPRNEEVFQFMEAGAPIAYLTPAEGAHTTFGDGSVAMLKSSPNPNAAKIFINFLLTKEGQTITSKTTGYESMRVDVPTDHLAPGVARQPGMKYFSTNDKGYLDKEEDLRKEVANIFQAYLKK